MPDYLGQYYANNGEKLKKMVDSILINFGGIYDKDKDDFYSIGNEVFASVLRTYKEGKQSFGSYLRNCISNRVKTEITRRNAAKRTADLVPMTAVNEDGEESEIDIASDFNLEEDILSEESAKTIYNSLSGLGKKIIQLKLQNKTDIEIKKKLGITTADLNNELEKMRSSALKNIKTTTHTSALPVKEKEKFDMPIGLSPDYRDEYYSVDDLKYKVECGELLINHPNQRSDWAWSNDDISTLVATILHGFRINPLIVCEEVMDGGTVLNWVVDGKQRITSLIHFAFPGEYETPIKITPKTEYTEIPYQVMVTDANGNIVRDELGRPLYETKIFDIKGKKFSDFPKQLQRNYLSYKVGATRYVNCDADLISYHIRRYNKGKQMTPAQKANTYLSDVNAAACKRVSDHILFKHLPTYTKKHFNNGTVDRTVMFSIMLMNYRENWKTNMNDMYAFYNENGDLSDFDLVEEYLTRIDNVIDDETAKLFTTKDAHFFIALFHEFAGMDVSDEQFNEFFHAYIDKNLGKKVTIENHSFDVILKDDGTPNRSTMAPTYINLKSDILHIHLNNFFNGDVDGNPTDDGDDSVSTVSADGMNGVESSGSDVESVITSDLMADCA